MVKLSPHTISMYCLRIRPDSRFGREKSHSFKSNPVYYDWYDKAREILLKNGYSQETNVRFKIEGRGGYVQQYYQFNCKPILGIGAGARSYTNTADYIIGGSANPKVDEIQKYIDDAENDTLKIKAGFILDDEERARRRLVLNLYRFNIKEFRELYQDKFDWIFKEKFEVLLEQGLLDFKDDVYFLTQKGYKYRDIISHSFFSEKVRELDKEFYECLI